MCGLAGILLSSPCQTRDALSIRVAAMGAELAHRGPDDQGEWVDARAGIALAHRRLSIQDLSWYGHQPMVSGDDRYTLVYNGEIYDFVALRKELVSQGAHFRGHSDTEVLLAAISAWGLERSLRRCNGMYALAVWDRQESCLWLARDRVGKKPLYYGWARDELVFGSELKALWQHPDFDNGIDRDALALLLRLDYIPAPYCIHRRAFKLMPGCLLRVDARMVAAGAAAHDPWQHQRPFWNARERMLSALDEPFAGDAAEAETQLDALLRQAVGRRMVADVPVGVFLSGGTDSSLVTAMMQAQTTQSVRSFSIGFEGSHHDEAPLAREVAAYLHTDHHELYVSDRDALEVVPRLPKMFDEPFADASQVPTALLAHLARGDVKVVLSGDGGDELFFGYRRYLRALRNWRVLARIPHGLRRPLAGNAAAMGEASRTSGWVALRAELGARGIGDVYRNRVTRWRNPTAVIPGARAVETFYDRPDPLRSQGSPADAMMLADFAVYLPDDLLCKIDRTTMAVGLEGRAPLLDWEVAEFAWSLPLAMKFSKGVSKYVLKRVLARYLPAAMVYRGKRGFGAPVSAWLQGGLRSWAGDLLARSRLTTEGVLDADGIARVWQRFEGGERKWHTHLWNVLMFEAWQDHWRCSRARVRRSAPLSETPAVP